MSEPPSAGTPTCGWVTSLIPRHQALVSPVRRTRATRKATLPSTAHGGDVRSAWTTHALALYRVLLRRPRVAALSGGGARIQRNLQGRGAWVCCSRCGVVESDASPVYMIECRHWTVCVGCGQNMVKVRPCQQQRPCVGCGGGEVERTAVRHPRAPGAHTRRSRLSFLGDPGPGCRVGFGRQRRLVVLAACK